MARRARHTIACITAAALALLARTALAGSLASLHNFTGGADGALPEQSVTFDAAGNMYGETTQGGALCPTGLETGCGTVFKIDPQGRQTTLITFEAGPNGATGMGNLTIFRGYLFGMAYNAGGFGNGLLFSIKTDGTQFSVLHRFTGPDGAHPVETLRIGADGTIYGTTAEGGSSGNGVLFQLTANGTYLVLHNFTGGADGADPGRIVIDRNGAIYGGTGTGYCVQQQALTCGIVYSYVPSTGAFTVLHTFPYLSYGGKLGAVGPDGSLYGSTFYTGATGQGSLFALRPKSDGGFAYQVLYSFTGGADGAHRAEPPMLTPNGALIGVSGPPSGTSVETSTLYEFDQQHFTTLYRFSPTLTGPAPAEALGTPTLHAGSIYGTTVYGGPTAPCANQAGGEISYAGCGTVYVYAP